MKKLITGILAILMCATCFTACDGLLGSKPEGSSSESTVVGGNSSVDGGNSSDSSVAGGNSSDSSVAGGGDSSTTSSDSSTTTVSTLSWAEFTAAEDGEIVTVSGVISGLVDNNSKHEIYFQDADGAYYAYNVGADMTGLAVGMEIAIKGTRGTNYGINQVKNATEITVLNSTPVAVQPTDITAELAAKEYNFSDADLIAKYQSKVVTITDVTILGQNASNESYYDFMIGGSVAYARISSSANLLTSEQTTAFEESVAGENIGKFANVTGVVSTYNGQIYLIPVSADAFSNIHVPNYTAEQKIAAEKPLVKLPAVHFTNNVTTIALPTAGKAFTDVTITWESSDNTLAAINSDGNELTVTLDETEAKEVTLTGTLACGEATPDTVTITIYLNKATAYVADNYTEMPAVGTAFKLHFYQEEKNQHLYFTGNMNGFYYETTLDPTQAVDVKTELVPNTTDEYYLYIQPARTKSYLYVYTSAKDENNDFINVKLLPVQDVDTDIPAHTWKWNADYNTFVTAQKFTQKSKGTAYEDYVYLGTYGSNVTIGASRLSFAATSYVAYPANVINGDTATVAEKLAKAKKDLTFSLDDTKAAVEGTFKTTITWASNNAAVAIAADGTITVTQGATDVEVTVTATIAIGTDSVTKDFVVTVPANVPPAANSVVTLAKAIAFAKEQGNKYTTDKYFITATIKNVESTTYGNMYLTDGTNELYVYGLYLPDGQTRYDAMETKPAAGDTITIYTVLGCYNGTPQAKNACAYLANSTLTLEQAINFAKAQGDNYTTDKYYVTAKIKSVESTTYGNTYLTDGTNDLYTYGLYSADGQTRYDAMETKPVANDEVTIYTVLGCHNGTPQAKNPWMTKHTLAANVEQKATIKFDDLNNRTEGTTSKQVWTQNGITVTNTGSVNPDYSNPIRCYKDSTVLIESANMKKITLTASGNDKYFTALKDSLTAANVTYTVDGLNVVIEFAEAVNSFTFGCTAGQVRLSSIVVVY